MRRYGTFPGVLSKPSICCPKPSRSKMLDPKRSCGHKYCAFSEFIRHYTISYQVMRNRSHDQTRELVTMDTCGLTKVGGRGGGAAGGGRAAGGRAGAGARERPRRAGGEV